MPSHRYEARVDSSSLQQSRELIADALLETLRAQRSVDVDYERLLTAIDGVAVRLAEKIGRARSR